MVGGSRQGPSRDKGMAVADTAVQTTIQEVGRSKGLLLTTCLLASSTMYYHLNPA